MSFAFGNAQSHASINEIHQDYQKCLDNADFMLGCSYEYFNKADSLLNIVYNKISIRLNKQDREKFRKEQLKWIKQRDVYFKKVRKKELNADEGFLGDDQKMVIADKQAEFIFERVEELLKRL
ncbi:lysozyme inhibitor LprI family protein [Flavobacterium wongokense]|uniref:lysozyme inhibitor LprI family protein n=1 Tax=Flavobacterium wongokense TaxID=2910674 RepID=UPI001F3EB2AA|nr:lysozyme inhibitor LprI family protein [Flavobacterium sp. WG47]MCF6131288.1 DUF1311 domain-containing protein [Flavobacterium sp. WG47]